MKTPAGSHVFYPRARAILEVVLDGFDTGPGSEDEPIVATVIPKTATYHMNGYQQADSWELGFDYLDLPFDPQLVRIGHAEIYLYDANGIKDETASVSRQYGIVTGSEKGPDAISAAAMSVGATDKKAFTGSEEPLATGLFDDQSINFSNDGKWVTISGQDYTALLIAKQWPPLPNGRARRIPVGKRLDEWAAMILAEADPGGKLKCRFRDVDPGKMPVVGSAEMASHARGIPVQQNTSYWDVLYKTITRYGYICYIRGYDLVITHPKNLDQVSAHDIKQMAWGVNLSSLQLTRHLGKEKVPRVVIHAYSDRSGDMLVVEEPDNAPGKAAAKMAASPSKRTTQVEKHKATLQSSTAHKIAKKPKTQTEKLVDEYIIIPIYGVQDGEALRRAAKMLRTLIGRGERKIVAKTRDLVDVDGRGLLSLEVGDAVEVQWQDFKEEVLGNSAYSLEERVQYLTERGFQPSVANAIATGYQRLVGRQRPLRVREATFEYDVSSGLEIEMELVDFVMVDGVRDNSAEPSRKTLDDFLLKLGFTGMGQ